MNYKDINSKSQFLTYKCNWELTLFLKNYVFLFKVCNFS